MEKKSPQKVIYIEKSHSSITKRHIVHSNHSWRTENKSQVGSRDDNCDTSHNYSCSDSKRRLDTHKRKDENLNCSCRIAPYNSSSSNTDSKGGAAFLKNDWTSTIRFDKRTERNRKQESINPGLIYMFNIQHPVSQDCHKKERGYVFLPCWPI